MKTIATLFLVLFICWNASAQTINTDKSSINFSADYLGMGSVEGMFSDFDGFIDLDEGNILNSSFDFTISANSISTKSNRRTRFLKGKDFFNTSEFETVSFNSTNVVFKNNNYIVAGDLTVKGIQKRIEIPFHISETKDGKSLVGNMIVNRFDFDLGSKYKEWVIGKEVKIAINCVVNTPKMHLSA